MARRPRGFFKASPWELEDAEEEGVEILINHAPKRFVIENGKLIGMEFERLEWGDAAGRNTSNTIDTVSFPPTTSSSPSARKTPSPGSSATSASSSTSGTCPWSTKNTMQSTRAGVFFGGDAALGPKNIIWAAEHGHQAAISIHNYCQGDRGHRAPAARE